LAIDNLSVLGDNPLRVYIHDAAGGSLRRQFGSVSVPSLGISLTYGTGSGQANTLYCNSRSVNPTSYDLVDLAGSLTDGVGNTITFTKIKLALLAIVSPDGTKLLRVGPQAQSNPFLGGWGGTGSTVYKAVYDWDLTNYEPVSGLTVTASTGDIFPVYNPGGSAVSYFLLLAGV